MFVGFNLRLEEDGNNSGLLERYYYEGRRLVCESMEEISTGLDQYIGEDGSLDASEMQKEWFHFQEVNVFLSHSHRDEKLAIQLAGYLYKECGIKCFIDSCIWGYADELLQRIDDRYCEMQRNDGGGVSYDYTKRNRSTSHVHMLLNVALANMIDRTECLIFLNTPNSILPSDIEDDSMTSSPWIYSELSMATQFPHRKLSEYTDALAHSAIYERYDQNELNVNYKVRIDELIDLDFDDIQRAIRDYKHKTQHKTARQMLDFLYLNKGLVKKI